MASKAAAEKAPDWRTVMRASMKRSLALIGAVVLTLFLLFFTFALLSYTQTDASPSTAAGGPVDNWMGGSGAWLAERALYFFGPAAALFLPFIYVTARRLWRDLSQPRWMRDLLYIFIGIGLLALGIAIFASGPADKMPAGWGGITGMVGERGLGALIGLLPQASHFWMRAALILLAMVAGGIFVFKALRLERSLFTIPEFKLPEMPKISLSRGKSESDGEESGDTKIIEPKAQKAAPRQTVQPDNRPPPEISEPSLPAKKATLGPNSRQGDFFGSYELPTTELLDSPPEQTGQVLDKVALERNARLLESVLNDFNVQGEVKAVRPGPVVTMYELEPAPGVKAQRVIGLAEDIARNMSALSARVAVIPGRNVIGIELPNTERDFIVLHEMIASDSFVENDASLPIILGKNISGDSVIADLAPMPHLLVAGTTGAGKSVGLNCMILSLLFRLTPDQCRLIMIDPKMLELSIYDDIPHLLSPVVTEPAKAVRALKWAVEQMEERYRMMSSISVRNLANFNEKVKAAKAKGAPLGRKVQTGYDPESGQPVFEEEQLDFEPLPQVVIIVDELADLMMTAGKEVEFLIQRLAQKARAAGIHLIMATQRPSVDVITGVIKANLPTRISFHVTSKIDSRTILGEQGAEQLLGKGDMLYMPGGKQLTRVHGPFVSDDEVRRVADHWRSQGAPDYIQSVTEEPEDGGFALDGASLDDNPEDQQYRKACQLVFESQKASTSWLQRQLRVGYNTAARLIERMEDDGLVSAANHVGRREVLRDQEGNPI